MDCAAIERLKARHAEACNLKQVVDRPAIEAAIHKWIAQIGAPHGTRIQFISSASEMLKYGNDAWAARDARAARAARDARDAWAAWAARDARAAWDAWDAWAARAAWDARAARAAWDARAACFDLSWLSVTAIGALSLNDQKTADIWLPTLEAFEAGAYALWVTNDCVYVSVVPSVVLVDEQQRLHCESGPAFVWLDGIEDYYWRGTNIPKEWITDKASLTAKDALTWQNLEQRRVACSDIMGWSRILAELDAKTIDEDGDPLIGTLVEARLPDLATPARFCRVMCGTGREFAVGVPPTINTALAAQAWMQGRDLKSFIKPEIRT